MTEFEFTYIASAEDIEDPNLEDRFFEAGCSDATLIVTKGLIAACFTRESDNYIHAVCSAYRDMLNTGVTVQRFEPDYLVSQTEIAKRAGLTRAAVSNYVKGDRGSSFPRPYARVTSNSPLWDWVSVSSWLHDNGQISREAVIQARMGRVVNLHLFGQINRNPADAEFAKQLAHA